jgi:hypothetical protein
LGPDFQTAPASGLRRKEEIGGRFEPIRRKVRGGCLGRAVNGLLKYAGSSTVRRVVVPDVARDRRDRELHLGRQRLGRIGRVVRITS